MNYPELLMACSWLALLVFWVVSAFSAKRYIRRSSMSWVVRLVIVAIAYALYRQPTFRYHMAEQAFAVPPVLQWVGAALAVCGVAFAIWARAYLGRNWGMPMSLKQDAELVTSGPYAYVRHPIYTGFIIATIGSCLVTLWWIIPLIGMSIYFLISAKTEEKIMTNEFGTTYLEYMKRTKMLIPFVF